MDAKSTGILIMSLGAAAIVVGAVVWTGALSWIGKLPGDINYSKGQTRIFAPITSMILISIVASLVLHLVKKLTGK